MRGMRAIGRKVRCTFKRKTPQPGGRVPREPWHGSRGVGSGAELADRREALTASANLAFYRGAPDTMEIPRQYARRATRILEKKDRREAAGGFFIGGAKVSRKGATVRRTSK